MISDRSNLSAGNVMAKARVRSSTPQTLAFPQKSFTLSNCRRGCHNTGFPLGRFLLAGRRRDPMWKPVRRKVQVRRDALEIADLFRHVLQDNPPTPAQQPKTEMKRVWKWHHRRLATLLFWAMLTALMSSN